MNNQATHPVLLILADISGYTRFMVSGDIETRHSQHIISELIQAIISEVEIPIEISKLEGDAIFLYLKKETPGFTHDDITKLAGRKLLLFFQVFHEKLSELIRQTSCRCGACSNLHSLRLKVVAHSGEALFYHIHKFQELSGTDVILVHRLLKNSLTGNEYLLLTESAYRSIQFPYKLPVMEGRERYEHLGQVKTFVYTPTSRITS